MPIHTSLPERVLYPGTFQLHSWLRRFVSYEHFVLDILPCKQPPTSTRSHVARLSLSRVYYPVLIFSMTSSTCLSFVSVSYEFFEFKLSYLSWVGAYMRHILVGRSRSHSSHPDLISFGYTLCYLALVLQS